MTRNRRKLRSHDFHRFSGHPWFQDHCLEKRSVCPGQDGRPAIFSPALKSDETQANNSTSTGRSKAQASYTSCLVSKLGQIYSIRTKPKAFESRMAGTKAFRYPVANFQGYVLMNLDRCCQQKTTLIRGKLCLAVFLTMLSQMHMTRPGH